MVNEGGGEGLHAGGGVDEAPLPGFNKLANPGDEEHKLRRDATTPFRRASAQLAHTSTAKRALQNQRQE